MTAILTDEVYCNVIFCAVLAVVVKSATFASNGIAIGEHARTGGPCREC